MAVDLRKRRRPVNVARGNAYAQLALEVLTSRALCLLQHDQNIANADGASVRADLNNALGALFTLSSGSSAPGTTIAYMLWADTTNGLLKQRNAANTGWIVRGTLAETLVLSRASNTVLGVGDFARAFVATAGFTQTLTAAATLGDGWFCFYRVNSGASVTLDPNGAETIDGAATRTIVGPASGAIFCNGASFFTYGFDAQPASDTLAGVIEIAVQSEMEAGTDTTRAVTPGRQHFHPSAAKCWGRADFAGSLSASYNLDSVTDTGVGDQTFNITTDFSSVNYAVVAMNMSSASRYPRVEDGTQGVGSVLIRTNSPVPANADATLTYLVAYGDQ